MTYHRFLCCFLVIAVCGCSGQVGITGKVVFDDGSPLEIGQIRIVSSDNIGRAAIEPGGTFRIASVSGRKGVPHGVYQVAIEGAAIPGEPIGPNADTFNGPFTAPTPLIAAKYSDPETSGLTLDTKKTSFLLIKVERLAK